MADRLTLADIYGLLAESRADLSAGQSGIERGASDSGLLDWQAIGVLPTELLSAQVRCVVIDSRQAAPGSVFVALRGEQTDGHQYVRDAFRRGAICALVEKLPDGLSPDGLWSVPEAVRSRHVPDGVLVVDLRADRGPQDPARIGPERALDSEKQPGGSEGGAHTRVCLLVDDALAALQRLAAWWRARFSPRVIGITGSIGKTTTKESVSAVLSQRYRVLKSQGNYNNEIGLPLTLLDLDAEHEQVVLEMGTYGPGEITLLAQIARPHVGIVTNVGPVHLERMGTIERIAQAKSELPRSLPPDGVAILNADDKWVRSMADVTPAKVFLYGLTPGGPETKRDLWADRVESRGLDGVRFRFHYTPRAELDSMVAAGRQAQEQVIDAHVPTLGRHSVQTALCAAAAGLVEGLSWDEILHGLCTGERLRLLAIPGINGSTLLDDTYNSSPDSAVAALNLLDELEGRKVAVLGDMLELGAYTVEGHRRVARRAMEVVSVLITVGELGRLIGQEAVAFGMPAERVIHVKDNGAAIGRLQDIVQENDTVLIKGSRGMAMEEIVEALARSSANGDPHPPLAGFSRDQAGQDSR